MTSQLGFVQTDSRNGPMVTVQTRQVNGTAEIDIADLVLINAVSPDKRATVGYPH